MISNYLKIVLRIISRQKTFAFINIFGLTVGLVGFILIFLYVRFELNYDTYHEKVDRLYMVVRDSFLDDKVYNFTPTPYPFKDEVVSEYPEIEKATRLDVWGKMLFHYRDKTFDEPVAVADKEIFDMFTFNFLEGDKSNPMPDNSSVVISKSIAEKYFGAETAVGKVFQVNGKYDFTIKGVFENLPENSSLKANIVLPIEFYSALGRDLTGWGSNAVNLFILLKPGVDVQAFEQKLKPRLGKHQRGDKPDELFLHPFKDIHLHNFHYKGGAIEAVYIFTIIGIAILLLAAINYVNLITARSVKRAKEIGIRKTVGAGKTQVVFQFLSESVLFTLLSLNFAVIVVELLLPVVNPIINKALAIDYSDLNLVLSLLSIAVVTGLLAGAYPAFYLAGFSPSTVLKNAAQLKNGNFKSALVVLQFSVSIALIITSIVLFKQFEFLKNKSVGFDKENILFYKLEEESVKQFESLRKEMEAIPEVKSVSCAGHLPTEIFANGGGYTWEGKDPSQDVLISYSWTDHQYPELFGMKILQGRYFKPGEVTIDTVSKIIKVVINEQLAKITGFNDPIGKVLRSESWTCEIIGVISDFNFLKNQREAGPLMLYYDPTSTEYGFIKISGDLPSVKSKIEQTYTKLFPQYPANFKVMQDHYQTYFGNEDRNAKMFSYFTLLAILISCLGLYGLASFIAEQRRKEMAIRKALGAETSGLSFLMLKDFAIWILISNAIAIPLAWFYSNIQLERYAFKTEISWWIFAAAAILSIIVAVATVLFQVLKTTKQNPAAILKYE